MLPLMEIMTVKWTLVGVNYSVAHMHQTIADIGHQSTSGDELTGNVTLIHGENHSFCHSTARPEVTAAPEWLLEIWHLNKDRISVCCLMAFSVLLQFAVCVCSRRRYQIGAKCTMSHNSAYTREFVGRAVSHNSLNSHKSVTRSFHFPQHNACLIFCPPPLGRNIGEPLCSAERRGRKGTIKGRLSVVLD